MNKRELWFWLCSAPGIYQDQIKKLLDFFETPEEIYKADLRGLLSSGAVSEEEARALLKEKKTGDFFRRLEKLEDKKIYFTYLDAEDFPEKLKLIPEHPYCLYYRGRLPNPQRPSCAIVGARACSEYGKREAVRFSSALACEGIQIISGMAAGIDSTAQKAALEAGGTTFAVLGGGVDVIYPAENTSLYWKMIAEGGGVISEYPPGTASIAWQFPHRNRLICGLSDKLLVIEARKRSGSLITARHALDQGRDIYALPGRVTDPLSEGCNELIFDGAGILLRPSDIINAFFWGSGPETHYPRSGDISETAKEEKGILKYLSCQPKSSDEIAKEAGIETQEAVSDLAMLELEGKAKEVAKDFYIRT